jgi:hypothetical protein
MGGTLAEAHPVRRAASRVQAKNLVGHSHWLYDDRQEVPDMRRIPALLLCLLVAAACASNPPRAQRSEFEDIPVPKGLTVDLNKSTIIESPTVKAARLFYKGRVEIESLALAFRTTLEANGWRNISATTASNKGITQIYEKTGSSLQVQIYEGWYYTWVEMSATRAVSPNGQPK